VNIHEAVLQPIAALVYYNRQAAAWAELQLNSAHGRSSAKIIL